MGWFFNTHKQTKSEFIQELLNDFDKDEVTVKHAIRGNNLWLLIKSLKTQEATIVLYLLSSENKCWGYKPISENAGPAATNCPKKFLKEQPHAKTEFSREWRKRVLNS